MEEWLYYRIYANPGEHWYPRLLTEIVRPFITKNEGSIKSFFFFHYHHPYGVPPYDSVEAPEPKYRVGEEVWFIRLRILAEQKNIPDLDRSLCELMKSSATHATEEKCSYNEAADLGNRFGESRRELVRDYLECASRLTLSLLDEARDEKYVEKVMGLIHLLCNMLEMNISITCSGLPIFSI